MEQTTEQVLLTCKISNSNPTSALGARLLIDDKVIYENAHVQEVDFEHSLDDTDGSHVFAIELFGKLPEHTKIDAEGNILEDAMLILKNITVDGIDITQLFYKKSTYHHNFNGTGDETSQSFYGNMGCNGQVRLNFNTPVYIWLLENM